MVNDWFTLKSAPPTAATVFFSSRADAPATVRLTAAAQTTAAATTLGMGVRIGSPFPAALVGRNDRRPGPGGDCPRRKEDRGRRGRRGLQGEPVVHHRVSL